MKIAYIDTSTHTEYSVTKNIEWLSPSALSNHNWNIFFNPVLNNELKEEELIQRYRLAGTFFVYTAMGSKGRKAIIHDLMLDKQQILQVNDSLNGYEIINIYQNYIVLKNKIGGNKIKLSLKPQNLPNTTLKNTQNTNELLPQQFGVINTSQNTWSFNRVLLINYYKELMDNPERLVLIFDSLKPLYSSNGWIEGYQVSIEGEYDFFKAVGIQENDIIRKVNDIKMTNRKRAEFFLKQFINHDVTVFSLEIDRGESNKKHTYTYLKKDH